MTGDWLELRVAARREEALDIISLRLVDAQGRELPSFAAGAHIDLELPGGLVRQYSLCSAAGRDGYEIAILRDPASRGGSVAAHALTVGQMVRASSPRNHFPVAPGATHSILLAGGIGITPLLCMAETLALAGDSFVMHYCTRSADRTAFRTRIAQAHFADSVHFHYDDGPEDQRFSTAQILVEPQPGAHLYICGPAGFIDHVLNTAHLAGWPPTQVHREYFATGASTDTANGAFMLKLASNGQTIHVPAHMSAAQALEASGIVIPLSCEQGICGACLTRVIEGEPDHRDLFLTDAEHAANNQFTPCCSRAKSAALVIDL
ncbi:vanillate O-demethylase ferredoxin subunit [Sphingobium xenophagum]|uniref:Vanillate O-demethylase ferredoxin subunit n=1 Tax=Sphingobium xenophagum TaxID=121428 RepID=A0ABU1WYH5_SPHXE|nr:PDR/VanB family oxidoreductase [Sphingobium xenophagum]MDR7154360.1 vanillate O-demethylase ferredoxin subunit [Sphingobium xenophagum]